MTKAATIHLATEFAPVLTLFIAGQLYPFEVAALTLVVATVISLVVSLCYEGRIPFLPLVSGALVIVSGLITFVYDKPDALIFADSVYYFLLAAIVGVGLWRGWYFLKWLFESTFAMYDEGWRRLSWRWFMLFLLAGLANETVRMIATPEFWVDYRFVKVIVIAIFACYQFTLARRYRIPELSNGLGIRLSRVAS